jgi:hypothetical protein
MRDYVGPILFILVMVVSYINNSVMGEDRELEALNRIRNSSGYLIKNIKDE